MSSPQSKADAFGLSCGLKFASYLITSPFATPLYGLYPRFDTIPFEVVPEARALASAIPLVEVISEFLRDSHIIG
ncbi:hypothetical protein DSECCO2_605320 [anaerobic digester metagenome]